MPLEPIEQSDLDLKGKFIEDANSEKIVEKNTEPKPELNTSEIVKPQEKVAEKEADYTGIISKTQTAKTVTPIMPEEIATDAEIANQEQGIEAKVTNLVNIAMQKGVAHAVKVARHLDDNFMLDSLHDKLMTDELHEALMQKGLIKNS